MLARVPRQKEKQLGRHDPGKHKHVWEATDTSRVNCGEVGRGGGEYLLREKKKRIETPQKGRGGGGGGWFDWERKTWKTKVTRTAPSHLQTWPRAWKRQ